MQLFFASLHGAKMKTLDEILGVFSEQAVFDPKTDEALEKRALERLDKMRKGDTSW